MKLRGNETLRERLAAAYVLGTLKGGARRRFEGLMHDDAALRRTTHEWKERLGVMAEFAPAQQPGAHVWKAIERRLDLRPAQGRAAWRDGSLAFWRSLALGSSFVAALLLVGVAVYRDETPVVSEIATLTDAEAQAAIVVTTDRERQRLKVRVLAGPALTQEQALQLWALGRDGRPRSLGVLGRDRELTLPLPSGAVADDVVMLAVSLEPAGGSPDPSGPSGPILYKGNWVRGL